MHVVDTILRDVKLMQPRRFQDDRGWFAEIYSQRAFTAAGLPDQFAQDNQSFSVQGVLRGLHYQLGRPQGKLIRVLSGTIWDVAVDLRPGSPDFGEWAGFTLSAPSTAADPIQLLWIPEGFAHGFLVLSQNAEVLYKTTAPYYPAGERCIIWDDPMLDVAWPLHGVRPLVSPKDAEGKRFQEAELPTPYVPSAVVTPDG